MDVKQSFSLEISRGYNLLVAVTLLSQSPVVHSGMLNKQGNIRKNWKKRWFELESNNQLRYYKIKSESTSSSTSGSFVASADLRGTIILDADSKLELVDDDMVINVVKQKRDEMEEQERQNDINMAQVIESYKKKADTEEQKILKNRYKARLQQFKSSLQQASKTERSESVSSPQQGEFRFELSTTVSSSGEADHKNRKHCLIADTEQARKAWCDHLAYMIIQLQKKSELEQQNQDNSSDESDTEDLKLHESLEKYNSFVALLTHEQEALQLVEMFNSIIISEAEKLSLPLMLIFDMSKYCNGLKLCEAAIESEISACKSAQTLFRRNSLSSKLLTLFFKLHGTEYLKDILGAFIEVLSTENKVYEIDPTKIKVSMTSIQARLGETTGEERLALQEKLILQEQQQIASSNGRLLETLCHQIFHVIMQSIDKCPMEIRMLLKYSFYCAEKHFPEQGGEIVVGGLLFLRYINPAMLFPDQYEVYSKALPKNALRTVTLITKVLQNVVNQVKIQENKKEQFMSILQPLITGAIEPVKTFLQSIALISTSSTPTTLDGTVIQKVNIPAELQLNALHVFHKRLYNIQKHKQLSTNDVNIKQLFKKVYIGLKTSSDEVPNMVKNALTTTQPNSITIPPGGRKRILSTSEVMMLAKQQINKMQTTKQQQTMLNLSPVLKEVIMEILLYFKKRTVDAQSISDFSKIGTDTDNEELSSLIKKRLCAVLALISSLDETFVDKAKKLPFIASSSKLMQILDCSEQQLSGKFVACVCLALNERSIDTFVKAMTQNAEEKLKIYVSNYIAVLSQVPYKFDLSLE